MIITDIQGVQELPNGTVIKEVGRPNIARLIATDDFRTWFYTGSESEFDDAEVHTPVLVIYQPRKDEQ